MATALINGKAIDWAMITVTMLGTPFTGITKISGKSMQEKTNNYGIGSEPVSRGRGRKTYEGSITFNAEEWKNIIAAAPNNEPLDIPAFEVAVNFIDPTAGTVWQTKFLQCEFMEHGFDASEGDTMIEIEVPLVIGKITNPVAI